MVKTSIGIRANPQAVYYCIVRGDINEFELIQLDNIIIPKALDVPEQLKFIRTTLADILAESQVDRACIRTTESQAQKVNLFRSYIEGIIQEVIASSDISHYYVGQISSISAKLSMQRESFKRMVDGGTTFNDLPEWNTYSPEERESVIAAVSALKL